MNPNFFRRFLVALTITCALWLLGGINVHAQDATPAPSTQSDESDDESASPQPEASPIVIPTPAETAAPPASAEQPSTEVPRPASMASPPPAPAPSAPPPVTPPPQQRQSLPIEFSGASVSAVLDYYARLTGRSIISSPNVLSVPPITFRSQTDLTLEEAIQALDSVLAINGIATIPMGEKFLKVVQIGTAKQEGPPVGGTLPPGDTIVTQVLPLKYADAAEVVAALQPYLHAYGQLLPFAKSNSILITETGGNINRMLEILKFVDQPSALRVQTKVYVLLNAKAADVVQRLQSIIQETQQLGARASAPTQPTAAPRVAAPRPGAAPVAATPSEESVVEGKVIITSDERTNKIFLLSRPSNFDFFDRVIAELDAKVDPDVVTKVIPLDFAEAEVLAGQLNALVTGGAAPAARRTTTTTTGQPGQPRTTATIPPPPTGTLGTGAGEATGFLQFAQGVRILPDPRTNSLLLMATKEDIARLEELIRDMDTPVAQVLVEVVIAEVNLGGTLEIGVSAFKRLFTEGQVSQTGGYNTGANAPVDLSSLATNLAPLFLSSGLTYFTTFNNLKLDAVLRLLSTSSKFKVLSTPIIQTLHNQEASIIVGESRPFPSTTIQDVVSGGATALRSSVEFKDIAIELTVTPRINPEGFVTMDIQQKINDVGDNVDVGGGQLIATITKREAKSSVTVKDQSTIVLGGLIRENKRNTETKVPFLGDIPLLGTLFKGKVTDKQRTELIVFIRPTVLRNVTEAVAEARRRAKMLKGAEEMGLEEKFFKRESKDSGDAPSTNKRAGAAGSRTEESSDRHTAKVKALQEQETGETDAGTAGEELN